jgi:2-(1,2-epoxy-1,2-dihydrophenyl)acetyl-CoA isomerase
MTDDLVFEVSNRVATLTLNRPDKLNALSNAMIDAAIHYLERAAVDPEVGAVVVTGAGRGFCAGGDVSAMSEAAALPATLEERIDRQRFAQRFAYLLHEIPKVTIAAVNGAAAGAGLGLALSCDLRLASDKAKLTTAFAKVGFGGDFGTTWQLTRLVGESKAKELFFLSEVLPADEALRLGLLNKVFPAERFFDEVRRIAERVASGPLVSYRYMKENVNLASLGDFRESLDREAITHLRCGQTEDHREGVRAFVEKREPRFRGR